MPLIYELTDENMMENPNGVLPNIIVSRYEANKKLGHVGIDENGSVYILQRLYHRIVTATLTPSDATVAVSWERANKFDLSISANAYFQLRNCYEGQEVTMVFNNTDIDVAILGFSTQDNEPIKWLNGDTPYVNAQSNAIITFYKSNGIIYAEIKRDYIGSSDSDGGS